MLIPVDVGMERFVLTEAGERAINDSQFVGFVRIHKALLPKAVLSICYRYWWTEICDEWNAEYKGDCINLIGSHIMGTDASFLCGTVYGTEVIPQNAASVYQWTLRVNKMNRVEGSNDSILMIGLVMDNVDIMKYYKHSLDWHEQENGHALFNEDEIVWWFVDENDVMVMVLDLKQQSLTLRINEIQRATIDNVRNMNYRLALSVMDAAGIEIQLI